mgnify:CR=1 FL=1
MERKKITFDSFIRGVILGVIIIGLLMLLKRLSSVLLPFFIAWLIAYLVYPLVTLFPIQAKVQKQNCLHILRIVHYSDYRCRGFLSVGAAYDTRIRQSTSLINPILFSWNIQ